MSQRHKNRISNHCLARWQERVDANCGSAAAHVALEEILHRGRRRSSNRSWTARVAKKMGEGVVAVVWAERPDVAVLVNVSDRVAMTVITRWGFDPKRPNDPRRLGVVGTADSTTPTGGQPPAATTSTSGTRRTP